MKAIAQKYGPDAIKEIAALAGLAKDGKGKAEGEAVRLGALGHILDRAYGKPSQVVAGDADAPLIFQEIRRTIVDPSN